MKSLKPIFNLLLFPFLFILLMTYSQADNNNINGSCPGEIISEIDGTFGNASHAENGGIGGNGNDRYRMNFPVAGTLSIQAVNRNASRNAQYKFYVSNTTCGNWNIVNGVLGRTHTQNVTVNAGDTIWVRLQGDISQPPQGKHDYRLALNFIPSSIPAEYTCPGIDVLNINGATTNAYQSYNIGEDIQYNSRYFKFQTAVNGNITIHQKNNKPVGGYWNHKLTIATSCNGTNIYNGPKSANDSHTFPVTAGTTYYIRVREGNNKNVLNFDIDFTFTSANINTPPTFTSSPVTTANETVNYTYRPRTNDIDGDIVTVIATTLPSWLSFNGTTLSGVPGVANAGDHTVTLRASDGNGGTAIQTFTVTVAAASNTAPVFTSIPITNVQSTTPYTYVPTTSDADGDTVSITATTLPSWLSFDGTTLSGTPTATDVGTHNVTLTADDGNGGITTQTFIITVGTANFAANNPRPFRKVPVAGLANTNIAGDLLVIGNQSLCWLNGTTTCQQPSATASNNSLLQSHINLDTNATTAGYLNSTSANLVLAPNDVVLEAWLYWIGRLNDNSTTNRANANRIKFKTPTSNGYVDLASNPGKFNWMVAGSLFDYGAAVDVTQFVQQGGTYWVADLQSTAMFNQGSGWALAVVVQDRGFPRTRTVKNISLYDGFSGVFNVNPYPSTVSSTIAGFLTPKTGTVKSNLIVFAGESDRALSDTMSLTKRDGTVIALQDSLNDPSNMQNGTISKNGANVTTRNPSFSNTLGIDIDELNVSNIIENNQTSTVITISSFNDRIFLEMYGFATDLYIPKVCYDYTVQRNNFDITSNDRSIIINEGNLSITVALQSLEGDFDFTNSQIGIRLTPTSNTSLTESLYAPNNINTFIPGIPSTSSTILKPMIGIGEDINVNAGLTSGGIIKANQRYFTQFNYRLHQAYNGRFEVDLNTTIDFGSGAVPVIQSTQYNNIPRCPTSNYYEPIEGSFNVERQGSSGAPNIKFPLYTQIVGKAFDFDVVAYNQSSIPAYSEELPLSGYTVDLELINADTFADQDSIFLCNNPNQSIVKSINSSGRKNTFARFNTSAGNSRVSMTNIQTDTALKRAAFRIWYIVDKNNTILPHNCPDPIDNFGASNTCFQTLYDTHLLNDDNITDADGSIGFCRPKTGLTNCSAYINPIKGTSGCYACLRDYFSRPVCSRDDFAIRPVSYHLDIADNGESNNSSNTGISLGINNSTTSVATLAAGYLYRLNGYASSYTSSLRPALEYNRNFSAQSSSTMSSTLNFDNVNNPPTCTDQNNTEWNINFDGGFIRPNLLTNLNVGEYKHHVVDANWTLVDQSIFQYKTFPGVNDCIPNSNTISGTNIGMSGCITDSIISANGTTYTDLQLTFMPYSFDISNILLDATPQVGSNFVYMNDFSNAFYTNPTRPLTMSVALMGAVIAKAKDNTTTTNFSNTCISTNVDIDLNRTMVPAESTLRDTDGSPVPFQQYLQESNSSIVDVIGRNKVEGEGNNTRLHASAFTEPGLAYIRLHTTLKKPLNARLNPVDINYTDLNVSSPNASSSAHMTTHIPEGNTSYNKEYRFYFAKVTPRKEYNPDIVQNWKSTPISVDIYCYDPVNASATMCNNFGLSAPSKGKDNTLGWYAATMFDGDNSDGIVDGTTRLTPTAMFGTTVVPNVVMSVDQQFDDGNGTQEDVNVSIVGNARPATIDVEIQPDPWLRYDADNPNGFPRFRNKFIGPSGWVGVGVRGQVVETTSTSSTRRMNW